jgi:hypothetical protein
MACIAPYDLLGVFRPRRRSQVCPVPTRSEQFGAKLGAMALIAMAVALALILFWLAGSHGPRELHPHALEGVL